MFSITHNSCSRIVTTFVFIIDFIDLNVEDVEAIALRASFLDVILNNLFN